MAEPIQWRAPEIFAAGDTLLYQRSLPDYLPSDGWSVQVTVTQPTPTGGKQITQFTSTPDASNKFHCFNVQNFLAGQDAGTYVYVERVICSPTGVSPNEAHTVYYNELELDPDFAAGTVTAPVLSFSEQWITVLEAKLLRLEAFDFTESDVQRTRFIIEERNKALDRLKWAYEKRDNERRSKAQRNTGQNQIRVQPIFAGGW